MDAAERHRIVKILLRTAGLGHLSAPEIQTPLLSTDAGWSFSVSSLPPGRYRVVTAVSVDGGVHALEAPFHRVMCVFY